jgi:hypothetical protein
MHPYFFYVIHRQRMAELERQAEVRRQLPQRERRSLPRVGSVLARLHLHTPVAAEARPCH